MAPIGEIRRAETASTTLTNAETIRKGNEQKPLEKTSNDIQLFEFAGNATKNALKSTTDSHSSSFGEGDKGNTFSVERKDFRETKFNNPYLNLANPDSIFVAV